MATTRRSFLKGILGAGGAAFLNACALAGEPRRNGGAWRPAYRRLEDEGKFAERIEQAWSIFEECSLCPHRCGVNRRRGERGFCRASDKVTVFSHHPHFGEELPLVGKHKELDLEMQPFLPTYAANFANALAFDGAFWTAHEEALGQRFADWVEGRQLPPQKAAALLQQ